MKVIKTQALTAQAFAPFGDVLTAAGDPTVMINQGMCARYSDLAELDFSDGQAGISIFKSEIRTLPYELDMVERHPDGSQAFIPMGNQPFMVVVAGDQDGIPVNPQAFIAPKGQAINFHRNIWHGVLTPLHEPGFFAVIDRIGGGENLEEYIFKAPYLIQNE
ncbi:MAG: ureidoglycolate lyase [Amylibacter sp.]|nr:ureidoglycolate lyase [Amylibacter sp.]